MTPKLNSPVPRLFNIILALLVALFIAVGILMYQQYHTSGIELQVKCTYKDNALSNVVCKELLMGDV